MSSRPQRLAGESHLRPLVVLTTIVLSVLAVAGSAASASAQPTSNKQATGKRSASGGARQADCPRRSGNRTGRRAGQRKSRSSARRACRRRALARSKARRMKVRRTARRRKRARRAARDTTPPQLSFVAPAARAKVRGVLENASCALRATDRGGVERVRIYRDGVLENTERYAPWNCRIDTTRLADGEHTLRATAIDKSGNRASDSVRVVVDNVAGNPAPVAPNPGIPDDLFGDVGQVLFDGSFAGGPSRWTSVQREGGGIASFTDGVGRFEIPGGGKRAEVYKGMDLQEGDDRWFSWRTKFGAGFPAEGKWQLVWQLHHAGSSGSPPLALEVTGSSAPGSLLLRGNGKTAGHADGPYYWRGPRIEYDRWYHFTVRVYHSRTPSTGFVELWLDGVKQTLGNGSTRMHGPTLYDSHNYAKLGYYRASDMRGTGVVYHEGYRMGSGSSAP
jgi:hypothetical protein